MATEACLNNPKNVRFLSQHLNMSDFVSSSSHYPRAMSTNRE